MNSVELFNYPSRSPCAPDVCVRTRFVRPREMLIKSVHARTSRTRANSTQNFVPNILWAGVFCSALLDVSRLQITARFVCVTIKVHVRIEILSDRFRRAPAAVVSGSFPGVRKPTTRTVLRFYDLSAPSSRVHSVSRTFFVLGVYRLEILFL